MVKEAAIPPAGQSFSGKDAKPGAPSGNLVVKCPKCREILLVREWDRDVTPPSGTIQAGCQLFELVGGGLGDRHVVTYFAVANSFRTWRQGRSGWIRCPKTALVQRRARWRRRYGRAPHHT